MNTPSLFTKIDNKKLAEVWDHADELEQDFEFSANDIIDMIPSIQYRIRKIKEILDPFVSEDDLK